MTEYYSAFKGRTREQGNWSAIFRHPSLLDPTTGRSGRRVRSDLGTAVDTEADVVVDQLNELLRTMSLWDLQARTDAAARFDSRVVRAFYDSLDVAPTDSRALRDDLLPLPAATDGYKHVLLLGTTGAGKTTVVRQLLGTDPNTERFPSTSTAKTTVADTEIALTEDGPYQAVVTFADRDEVVAHLEDNISAAALAVYLKKPDQDVLRRLLDHVDQRFRFSYVLGRPDISPGDQNSLDDDDEEEEDGPAPATDDLAVVDLDATATTLRRTVSDLHTLVNDHVTRVHADLQPSEGEEHLFGELLEEAFDADIRQPDRFHHIADRLADEMELRFSLLSTGTVRRTHTGWPLSWTLSTNDRKTFLQAVMRFSSNHSRLFGLLLTPLVNGIRVTGPFAPAWAEGNERLVLIDVEGLGHTPKSVSALSTVLAKRLDEVDAILLVDNATAPMQAAPFAALKSIAVSGNAGKLHFLFTHFDQMKADNFSNFEDRKEHVIASVENVLKELGSDLGPVAERGVRRRMEQYCHYAGGMDRNLGPNAKKDRRSIAELRDLIASLAAEPETVTTGPSRLVLDSTVLERAVAKATDELHTKWRGLLGLDVRSSVQKEHWSRIKALNRRMISPDPNQDEYDSLKPVAELRLALQTQILLALQSSTHWDGGKPDDDECLAVVERTANAITSKLHRLVGKRLKMDVQDAWHHAYLQQGKGSTTTRAHIIDDDVLQPGAPLPDSKEFSEPASLSWALRDLVAEVADKSELCLR